MPDSEKEAEYQIILSILLIFCARCVIIKVQLRDCSNFYGYGGTGEEMIGKIFDRIQAIRPVATKAEIRLIDRLCEIDKKDLIYLSITDLSDMVGVAEATILRFCRKLDFKGFQDFKLRLSQDIAAEDEEVQGIPQSIAEQMMSAIRATCEQIDYQQCLKVADLIINARKACAFAVGNSAIATHEAKNRLIKAGINLENSGDVHNQTIIAANLNQNDLLILVSVSGSTKDIIHLAEIGRENGTPIVVITNYSKSPLAKYADYLLLSCRKEAAYEGGSLATVVAQSYIIDVLCTAVFERLGSEAKRKSIKASNAVSDKSV